nr:immunoglobulin light chain junction region [Macaca mulatta]MOW29669.1 immunoglobulin light chain junction region [Macaca mulatta]
DYYCRSYAGCNTWIF